MYLPLTSREAAEYLLPRLDAERFQGVCFFQDKEGWMIIDNQRHCLPRKSSPIAERDAFVIFDDARCRGADLQLQRGAVGLLTLGPKMCKDKLMQAAGRLRQLGRGQTLRIVGTAEITASIMTISQGVQPTSLHVLQWAMHNTVQTTMDGIPEWSRQGLHFANTKDAPERTMLDEVLRLEDFYGRGRAQLSIADVVGKMADTQGVPGRKVCPMGFDPSTITQRALLYGSGHFVHAGGTAEEECERELEAETELEQEVVTVVPRVTPCSHLDWDYQTVFTASAPTALSSAAQVMKLEYYVGSVLRGNFKDLAWSPSVYCTGNFAFTFISDEHCGSDDFHRPLNWILAFLDGKVLLVSEREADAILELMWTPAATHASASPSTSLSMVGSAPMLVNLCYASAGHDTATHPQLALPVILNSNDVMLQRDDLQHASRFGVDAIASLQLLNGHASFSDQQIFHLRSMVSGHREAALALVSMRGKLPTFPRSHLEKACDGATQE